MLNRDKLKKRITALFLAVVMCASFVPELSISETTAEAASTATEAMELLRNWGIVYGDQNGNLNVNNYITRAEFTAMINRAYGYTEKASKVPFKDVPTTAWYCDDISIAYNAGYYSGTASNTASPTDTLTREQALVILARNMRMQETSGEVTDFNDGRDFGTWSMGYVNSAVTSGLITGYSDNTFKPKNKITRGEVAILITRALGTLINEEGTQSLGSVYGNVTINTDNVTLSDTTIAGNLYISGGLGLGTVTMSNVNVLGEIIIAGTGSAESGGTSIVFLNTTASDLIIDNIAGNYVSVRTEGDTLINNVTAYTSCFLEDRCAAGEGMISIALRAESGSDFNIAGTVKNVRNYTPEAKLALSSGTAQVITLDEVGAGSSLDIALNTVADTVNLDCAATITGDGDIGSIAITANGTTVAMLPDSIDLRSGITATINGTKMDTVTAAEVSSVPRLLSGYPKVSDIAPTTATAVFKSNKAGTVYWAVSAVADGSIGKEDLMASTVTNGRVLKNGKVTIKAADTETTAKISGLTAGGTYYLSTIMVDSRGSESPLKVVSFETTDNSTPNFSSGYPAIVKYDVSSLTGRGTVQVSAMSTKSCELYYVVYEKGSSAPTGNDLRSGAVTGNLGYGKMTVEKNTPVYITLSGSVTKPLEEKATYDIYFWLTDADAGKSSSVKKLSVTMPDRTPPEYVSLLASNGNIKATSLGFSVTLNEAGTVYWVAVPTGTAYPKPSTSTSAVSEPLDTEYARIQVSEGTNASKHGKVTCKANTQATITISGLAKETMYDIYYVAADSSGNFAMPVRVLKEQRTLDTAGPDATLSFSSYDTPPAASTDITITFDENILQASTNKKFIDMYQAVLDAVSSGDSVSETEARNTLAEALESTMALYDNSTGRKVAVRTDDSQTTWTIDYRYARIEYNNMELTVTFQTVEEQTDSNGNIITHSALNLNNGYYYYFLLTNDIADTSSAMNKMTTTKLSFTTAAAQVTIKQIFAASLGIYEGDPDGVGDNAIDLAFSVTPHSTSRADESQYWDMFIWSDTTMEFTLYQRISGEETWHECGGRGQIEIPSTYEYEYRGQSYFGHLTDSGTTWEKLTDLEEDVSVEYAIHITSLHGDNRREYWSGSPAVKITVVSSEAMNSIVGTTNIGTQNSEISWGDYQKYLNGENPNVSLTLLPSEGNMTVTLTSTSAPTLAENYPKVISQEGIVEVGDTWAYIDVLLDHQGIIYYWAAPAGSVTTKAADGTTISGISDDIPHWNTTQPDGTFFIGSNSNKTPLTSENLYALSSPNYSAVSNKPEENKASIRYGNVRIDEAAEQIALTNLTADTNYFLYLTFEGSDTMHSVVYLFYFKTAKATNVITLSESTNGVAINVTTKSTVEYALLNYTNAITSGSILQRDFTQYLNCDSNDPDWVDDIIAYLPNKVSPNGTIGTITVLEAMVTRCGDNADNSPSLFDVYASSTLTADMMSYIRSEISSGDNLTPNSSVEVSSGTSSNVSCYDLMNIGTYYVFLAFSTSSSDPSSHSFRALYPLEKKDVDAPVVTSVSAVGDLDSETNKFSGTLSVQFNETLYWLNQTGSGTSVSQTYSPLVSAPMSGKYTWNGTEYNVLLAGSTMKSIQTAISVVPTAATVTVTIDNNTLGQATIDNAANTLTINNACEMLTLEVENMNIGGQITFNSSVCDEYGNRHTSGGNVVPLTLMLIKDTSSPSGYSLTVTSQWDGR